MRLIFINIKYFPFISLIIHSAIPLIVVVYDNLHKMTIRKVTTYSLIF